MTDHKPLSEGDIVRRLNLIVEVHPIHAGLDVEWRSETLKRAAELIERATPKPLDGEAGIDNDMLEHLESVVRACSKEKRKDAALQEAVEVAVGTIKDIRAFLSLPAQTCEATDDDLDKFANALYTEMIEDMHRLLEWNELNSSSRAIWRESARHILAKAALCIVKDGSPTQARPEEVFDALAATIRQHSEQIQWQLREGGWIIVRAAT